MAGGPPPEALIEESLEAALAMLPETIAVVKGYLAFVGETTLTRVGLRHLLRPAPRADGADARALPVPSLELAQPGVLAHFHEIVVAALAHVPPMLTCLPLRTAT
jgi:hypothetical protein